MPTLLDRLKFKPVLLADGAWGSHFVQQGLDVNQEPADVWNLRHPDRVARLAEDYAADADILSTNTFGANRVRLARFGLDDVLHEINVRGAEIARRAEVARGKGESPLLIAGTMGPARGVGVTHPDDAALFEVYQEQAAYLAESGANFLLLETMTDLNEASIAVRAAGAAGNLEVVCSFAFRETEPGHFETWAGQSVEAALQAALEAGASMAGANCIPSTDAILTLIETMRNWAGSIPLWLKPNAGQPDTQGIRIDYPHPLGGAPLDRILDALGPGVIGGCCGTTPDDIQKLRATLNRRRKP